MHRQATKPKKDDPPKNPNNSKSSKPKPPRTLKYPVQIESDNTEEDAGCVEVQLTLLETAGNPEQKHLEGQDRYPEQFSQLQLGSLHLLKIWQKSSWKHCLVNEG